MSFLPDWLPNIHPIIVHFPIALLVLAIGLDVIGLFVHRQTLSRSATALLGIGAIGTVAAYFSGQQAADSVLLPPLANPVLNQHSDLGLLTMLFFLVYAILRIFATYRNLLTHKLAIVAAGALSLLGLYLLYETGEHGAELVFKHGVGVAASETAATPMPGAPSAGQDSLIVSASGSWSWDPGEGAALTLTRQLQWLSGVASQTRGFAVVDSGRGMVLQLNLNDNPVMLTAGDSLVSVQMDVMANVDALDGSLHLLHHVVDANNYDFLGVGKGMIELGRVRNGEQQIMDRKAASTSGWLALSVVGDGRHFRGYVNKKLVVHGHGPEPPPGLNGILLSGTGMALLDQMMVTSLK